jgi:hypothetical protein
MRCVEADAEFDEQAAGVASGPEAGTNGDRGHPRGRIAEGWMKTSGQPSS